MQPLDPSQPYNALLGLPPRAEIETKQVLKKCIEATRALAELKQASGLLPNQGILISTLPLLEAQASSEIENIITTADDLFRYSEDEENANAATKEVLRYNKALYQGFMELASKPISTNTAINIVRTIKGIKLDIRKVPGTALLNQKTGEVVYTPPVGEDLLREKLSNWEKFLHENTEFDPLIKMAIGHYQFEAIHPFSDGNGRTGRILNILFLIEQKLLILPVLYLSRYIIREKSEYYRLLLAVTMEEDWEGWILFMLEAVRQTALWTLDKVKAIAALLKHTIEHVRQMAPQVYSKELVEVIFEKPYSQISDLVSRDIAKRQTASTYLKVLTEIGVLKEVSAGRGKYFVHPKLAGLLSAEKNTFTSY